MADLKWAAAIAAAAMLAVQPCAAAEDIRDGGLRERQVSAFAGVNLRIPIGGKQAARPSARLQLTAASTVRDLRSGSTTTTRAHGFEVGAGEKGGPAFFMGGEETAEMGTKLGIGGSTTTAIVIGGAVLLVLVIFAASKVPPQPDFDD
jgi:hypothetical protein